MEGGEPTLAEADEIQRQAKEAEQVQHLFDNCWVFLSREVPRYSLEFVLAAAGGRVSWPSTGGVGGGPFPESDPRITHHVVDRPSFKPTDLKRHYVQPQWVYDCINAKRVCWFLPWGPFRLVSCGC
jgi:pescadillo